jgi:mycothiol synthase
VPPAAPAVPAQPALTWYSRLDPDTVTEVTTLLDAATAADQVAPVSENVLLRLPGEVGPAAGHLLARDPSGRLVGYAFLEFGSSGPEASANPGDSARSADPANPRDSARSADPASPDGSTEAPTQAEAVGELAVHPDVRRRGVGGRLVRALLDRVGGAPLRLWAHGEHPGAARLADRYGFRRVRTLWQLHRDLREPPGEPEFPADVRLRAFVVGRDEPEFLRVNNAAFAWHPEQGGWDLHQVKVREAEPWFDPAGFLLAVEADDPDRVLGFHWTKVHPDGGKHGGPIGEVYVLGVDPAAWGRRLGTALTVAGLRHLRDRGLVEVMLYVEADNTSAVRVYRRLGFTHWRADTAYRHDRLAS